MLIISNKLKSSLEKNKDLTCTNADKGNISVLMRRSEYIMDNWRKKGLLGKDTIWRDIDTSNTVLARCYGLRKFHKENYPLRLVISIINTATRF